MFDSPGPEAGSQCAFHQAVPVHSKFEGADDSCVDTPSRFWIVRRKFCFNFQISSVLIIAARQKKNMNEPKRAKIEAEKVHYPV